MVNFFVYTATGFILFLSIVVCSVMISELISQVKHPRK